MKKNFPGGYASASTSSGTTHLLLATRSSLIGKNLGFAWVPERTSWKFSEEISLGTQ